MAARDLSKATKHKLTTPRGIKGVRTLESGTVEGQANTGISLRLESGDSTRDGDLELNIGLSDCH